MLLTKFLPLVFLISTTHAQKPLCGPPDREWGACRTASDCTLVPDGCGLLRIATGKAHADAVQKYYACMHKGQNCPLTAEVEKETSPLKCEAYQMRLSKQKPASPTCMRLSDIVGMAINNDDRARIEAAIDEVKNVDMSLSHIHETPLTLAALNAKTELVRWLLSKGAKINFQTKNGYTALMFAAMGTSGDIAKTTETVALLLKSGADKELRNERGETALDQAKRSRNADVLNLLK